MAENDAQTPVETGTSQGPELHGPDQKFASGEVLKDDGKSWFQRVLHTRGYRNLDDAVASRSPGTTEPTADQVLEPQATDDAKTAESRKAEAPEQPSTPAADAPFRVFQSKDDYDAEIDRLAQSKKDRDRAAEKRREREAERKRLREDNPLAFAEKDAEWEAEDKAEQEKQARVGQESQRMGTVLSRLADTYDAEVITPVVGMLSDEQRDRILKGQPDEPIKGRAYIVTESIKALVAQAEKSAEAKLRNSDAFRKQILVELRGTEEDPELAPASGTGGGSTEMGSLIRQAYHHKQRYG